jgi:1,2-diacylglycerol 3-alpha-glucosyltransferase
VNIAIFTNNYLPNPYGVTVSIESFRKELEARGHNVYIFAPRVKEYVDANPHVYRYSSLDIAYKFRFPLPIPFSARAGRFLRELDIDIIHAQHPNLLGQAAARWAKKKNVPLVFTWHTLYDKYTHFSPPFIPESFVTRAVIQNAVKYADKSDQIIVPTPSVKKIIRDWGVTNAYIKDVPTGIDESLYNNSHPQAIRDIYNIQEGKRIIFTTARLTDEKNVDFLIRAIVPILKKRPQVRFFIGGDGYLRPKFEALARQLGVESQVHFLGIIPNEELPSYYAACDVFVYASLSETQGLVVTEALYSGAPIVALKGPGIQDIVMNKITGFLVEGDEQEFTNAVENILDNPQKRKDLSQKAKEVSRSTLSQKICTDRLLKVYEEAIRRKEDS